MAPFVLRSILALASVFGVLDAAAAAIINIPAVTFVPRNVGITESAPGELLLGMLGSADGRYYAPVIFPSVGNVCSFSLVFRDPESELNISAKLIRRGFVVGADPFTPPLIMASLTSTGSNVNTRRIVDTTITQPTVNLGSFYFVELTIPILTMQVHGVQIDFRTTACP